MKAGAFEFCRTKRLHVYDKISALKMHAKLECLELIEACAKVGFNLSALSVFNNICFPQGTDTGWLFMKPLKVKHLELKLQACSR